MLRGLAVALLLAALSAAPCESQRVEDLGGAAISFLLRNPKSADMMKPDEKIALEILADLLRTQGQRKHELEYATSGRDQIVIQTGQARQTTLLRAEDGSVFVVDAGRAHSVAAELVNVAVELSLPDNPENAIKNLLAAVRDSSLSRMALLWGTEKGPAITYMPKQQLFGRLAIIRRMMRHQQFQILPSESLEPTARQAQYQIVLIRGECAGVVPFTLARYAEGWIVQNMDLRQFAACQ